MVPYGWQPLQSMAPPGPHQKPERLNGDIFAEDNALVTTLSKRCNASHLPCVRLMDVCPGRQPQEYCGSSPAYSLEKHRPPHVTIGDVEVKSTQQFIYLGCIMSSDSRINKESDNRLSKAKSSFGRLYKHIWSNKSQMNKTKNYVYRSVVLTTLLYGSETCVIYHSNRRLLERLHRCCLHTILNICWCDFVTIIETLQQANFPSIEAMLFEVPPPTGRQCLQNGGQSFTKDCSELRTFNWPHREVP